MVSLAEELSEQDVDNLAEYYVARIPPDAAPSSGNDISYIRCLSKCAALTLVR